MRLQTIVILILVTSFFSCNKKGSTTNSEEKEETTIQSPSRSGLFTKIPASQSNILFSNNLQEDVTTIENLFDFDYFYNGAGVGVADFNNDGLQDIFFAGNQVANKLYVNQGDFVFEDISDKAHVNAGKIWANGVTFVDINNDGFIDIYVSQGGPKRDYDRHNLLYINQGDLTFKESAKEYGLDDNGISTQSVFFDYDQDGDLDCFVSNENEFYGLDPITFYNQMKVDKGNLLKSSTHLYQNNNGKFVDVSEKAGVLAASFGLGLTVADINNDGWQDLYVANDYYVPDALYINNKNGTFSNKIKEYTNQITFFGMGVDIADVNNDKLQDIFVLDMASSDHIRSKTLMASMDTRSFNLLVDRFEMPYQYMFNSLQLNAGNNKFHNVAQMAKVSKTDWSWAGLMVDFDLDGLKDIYVTNGYRKYALDNDSRNLVTQAKQAYNGNVPIEIKQKLYDGLPSEKLSNILYRNTNNLHFDNETNEWGFLEPSFSNGAAYADFDNDGDLDLVVNNIDEVAFLYKNNTVENEIGSFLKVITNGITSEPFAKVTVVQNEKEQFIETKRVKGYLSATENDAYFGIDPDSNIDIVRVVWQSGKFEEKRDVTPNSILTFDETEAAELYVDKVNSNTIFKNSQGNHGITFTHTENPYDDFAIETLLPYKQSTLGPYISKGDVNGDGLEDLYVGGASGQSGELFIQTPKGFSQKTTAVFKTDLDHEDMQSIFFDADGDNDQDLYVVSGGNEFEANAVQYRDRLYINDGTGNFSKSNDETINTLSQSGKSVAVIDYDKDGDLDVLVGNRIEPQKYPMPAASYILENTNGVFKQVTTKVAPELKSFGMINEILATDFNKDGWEDFIAAGEWGAIGMFQNNEGVFENISERNGLKDEKGLWFSISETDVNKDGLPDYVVGNIGANIKYSASKSKPFRIFGNDFDDNGTYDIVLSTSYQGKAVPFRGRQCSSEQMPFIAEKFETFNEFANASLSDVYGDKLDSAFQAEINTLYSMVLMNEGEGNFKVVTLPSAAQNFPLMDVVFRDLNSDGYEDAILTGNIYNTEVETPRLDAGTGLVLLGGRDGYSALPVSESGLYIKGNSKSLIDIDHKGLDRTLFVAGVNNEAIQVFELN